MIFNTGAHSVTGTLDDDTVFKFSTSFFPTALHEHVILTRIQAAVPHVPWIVRSLGVAVRDVSVHVMHRIADQGYGEDNVGECSVDEEDLFDDDAETKFEVDVLTMGKVEPTTDPLEHLHDLDVERARSYAMQSLCAIHALNNVAGVTHYDIHLGNVMMTECHHNAVMVYTPLKRIIPTKGIVPVVIDFGMSYAHETNGRALSPLRFMTTGTTNYKNDETIDIRIFMKSLETSCATVLEETHNTFLLREDVDLVEELKNLYTDISKSNERLWSHMKLERYCGRVAEFIGSAEDYLVDLMRDHDNDVFTKYFPSASNLYHALLSVPLDGPEEGATNVAVAPRLLQLRRTLLPLINDDIETREEFMYTIRSIVVHTGKALQTDDEDLHDIVETFKVGVETDLIRMFGMYENQSMDWQAVLKASCNMYFSIKNLVRSEVKAIEEGMPRDKFSVSECMEESAAAIVKSATPTPTRDLARDTTFHFVIESEDIFGLTDTQYDILTSDTKTWDDIYERVVEWQSIGELIHVSSPPSRFDWVHST